MSGLSKTLREQRLAELDPFEPQKAAAAAQKDTRPQVDDSYGCVDWFVYGESGTRAPGRGAPARSVRTH
ncbi:MAG TPA: hypothetical protein VKQ31_03785 [Steroidobacteraceae bacterium]|nr:hypothetical protein [Steroidobacteraceae bacterium]